MADGPEMAEIRAKLAAHRPVLAPAPAGDHSLAAVALVFLATPSGGAELLFIERALKEGDPWSGHMAFPGGRRDRGDPNLAATSMRETREEVGLELGSPIARLDDFANTRAGSLVVSPFVYQVDARPRLTPNREVQSTVWIPVPWLVHPDAAIDYEITRESTRVVFPAVRYDRFTVWGLTYRILVNLFGVLGRELRPAP
ncbi:MAG TPA: CoA pyrophosphatase [Myxococcota bacterium]|nr:CoA pyrophosphatase [Myxococcota bacterium]